MKIKCSLLFILLMLISYSAISKEIKSNVIVLIDLSTSYFIKERHEAIQDNFIETAEAIAKKGGGPRKSSLIQVLPIKSVSEAQSKPICEYTIIGKNIIKKKTVEEQCKDFGGQCGSKENFSTYMNDICLTNVHTFHKKEIVKEQGSIGTDIDGAISLASQIANSQVDNDKYLIIHSDMAHWMFGPVPLTPYELDDFRILVVCSSRRIQEEGKDHFCMTDPGNYRKKLEDKGAWVEYVSETGKWGKEQSRDLFR